MKILVTGAGGFIADHLITELLLWGHEVIATSRNTDKVESKNWFDRVRFIPYDIESGRGHSNCFELFLKPDAAIHLAWPDLPDFKTGRHLNIHAPAHFSFLEQLVRSGLPNLSVAGTCQEYGMIEGKQKESMKILPVTAYATAKNEVREKLEQLSREVNFSLKWLRLYYIFGEGQYASALYSQVNRAIEEGKKEFNMSGGEQGRDYLPVEKMVRLIASVAVQTKETGIINCCSGSPVKIKDLVGEFFRLRNYQITLNLGYYPYPDYEPMNFWGDTDKLNRIISAE
ncbi:MAG: NAD-dependent epimerase/dehydratase family protein [Bacteroidia bacterium]